MDTIRNVRKGPAYGLQMAVNLIIERETGSGGDGEIFAHILLWVTRCSRGSALNERPDGLERDVKICQIPHFPTQCPKS